MSVKATECAGEDEGMKFVPPVEKKRLCRHVEHSRGKAHYTLKKETQDGTGTVTRIELTDGAATRMVVQEVRKQITACTVVNPVSDDLATAISIIPPPLYVAAFDKAHRQLPGRAASLRWYGSSGVSDIAFGQTHTTI